MSDRDARRVRDHVDDLEQARRVGRTPAPATAAWVDRLPDETFNKLVTVGLVEARVTPPAKLRIGELVDMYVERRRTEVKPRSVELIKQTGRKLIEHIGRNVHIAEVSSPMAAQWRSDLLASGLSEATCRLHTRNARAMFSQAMNDGQVETNPFGSLPTASVAADRDFYLCRDDARKILHHIANPDLRAVVALGRFAGLRVPSETHTIRWRDVDLDAGKIAVYSPKRHRHGTPRDSAIRIVPIVPELAKILRTLERGGPNDPVVRVTANNLHRQTKLAIKAAGLPVWGDLFQTMRRSCETDLCESFPAHVTARWLGHSVQVAEKHYLQVPEDLYRRASGLGALHNALQESPIDIDLISESVAFVMAEISGRDLRNSALSVCKSEQSQEVADLYSVQVCRPGKIARISAGPVAQRLEQATHNRSVAGSTPARAISTDLSPATRGDKAAQREECCRRWCRDSAIEPVDKQLVTASVAVTKRLDHDVVRAVGRDD